jgi:hypothetical protein
MAWYLVKYRYNIPFRFQDEIMTMQRMEGLRQWELNRILPNSEQNYFFNFKPIQIQR